MLHLKETGAESNFQIYSDLFGAEDFFTGAKFMKLLCSDVTKTIQ